MEKIIRKGNDLEEVLNEFYSETELTKDFEFLSLTSNMVNINTHNRQTKAL